MRARRRCLLFLGIDAGTQGIHEIDHLRCRTFLRRFDLFASLLLFEQIDQRVLVAVLELRRIEVAGFGLDDVSGEIEHLFRGLEIGNVLEIGLFVANFIGIAQRKSHQTAAARLEGDDVFSARQHNPTESNHAPFWQSYRE